MRKAWLTPGGGNGIFYISKEWEGDDQRIDKTWQEIWDAAKAGSMIVMRESNETEEDGFFFFDTNINVGFISNYDPPSYTVILQSISDSAETYETTSPDGYPIYQGE